MKATFLDLRKKSAEILRAIDRREEITLFYRGRPKAVIQSLVSGDNEKGLKAGTHPSFGMWAERKDLRDVSRHVRTTHVLLHSQV